RADGLPIRCEMTKPMPKIDIAAVPERKGTGYPPQFNAPCAERIRRARSRGASGISIGESIRPDFRNGNGRHSEIARSRQAPRVCGEVTAAAQLLPDCDPIDGIPTRRCVLDLKGYDIAARQFAVDCEIEHS